MSCILHERMSWRQIPLDGRAHLPDVIRLWQGDSVGHWEGDTLVIDTKNLNGKTWLDELGGVITHQATVVERFIPVDAQHHALRGDGDRPRRLHPPVDDCDAAAPAAGRAARGGVPRGQPGSEAPEGHPRRGAREGARNHDTTPLVRGRDLRPFSSPPAFRPAPGSACPPFLRGGVRRGQAGEADRQAHVDAVVQPARVDLRGRHRCRRQGRELGVRDVIGQRLVSRGMAQGRSAGRRRSRHRRLAGTQRHADRQRLQHHVLPDGKRLFAGSPAGAAGTPSAPPAAK